MSIGSVMNGLNSSLNNLNRAHSAQSQSIQRIATGSKHPSAAYGASDYAIAQKMQYNIGGVRQSNTNTQNANSMLNVAGGAVSNTISSLSSLRETLINAANGTNGSTDVAALQESVNQTLSQVNANAQATYNGKTLLDGSQTVTVAGIDGYENVSLGDMSTKGLGLTDSQGNSTINLQEANGSVSGLSQALDTVDSALNKALDEATNIGAAQQGMEYQSANYTTMEENLQSALSTSDDADIAAEAVNNASAKTQSQAALWAVKQGMQNLSQQMLGALNNHSRGAAYNMLS
ncbi:MAG: bacitracin resistance protein BacA [Selenomonas sp.]|uniref:flagellin n=1 Tax=Selenomonas sp. TaxID=2053611 RepID=UPI0025DDE4D5|nr:flagellin [Selenomonas sp.]MCR5757006.1 bacitracin resistance protein BacA [Selenomonas sp.]